MAQSALEQNPDIHFINTGTLYGPLSVRINEVSLFRLSRFGRGGGAGGRVSAHNSRALSLSASFLWAWARGTLMCFFACFLLL